MFFNESEMYEDELKSYNVTLTYNYPGSVLLSKYHTTEIAMLCFQQTSLEVSMFHMSALWMTMGLY